MASLLQEAEQQGILDVYLAKLTHHEWLSVPQNRIGYPKTDRETDSELLRDETTVHHWRRLDDSKPGFKEEILDDKKHDCILQGEHWLNDLEADKEEDDYIDEDDEYEDEDEYGEDEDGCDSGYEYQIRFQRWKYRAGFVIWARQNRWPNFCRQGISAAFTKLGELVAAHKALKAQNDAADLLPDAAGDVCMSPAGSNQEAQALEACREDVVSLIQSMYSRFKDELTYDETEESESGFEGLGLVAMAFDLPGVYESLLQDSLHELNPGTAQKLIRASAGLGWSSLYPLLTRMADNTCSGADMHMQAFLPHLLPALEALQLLLGVEDPGMQAAVAAIAAQIVASLQRLAIQAIPESLYGYGSYDLITLSTKPWASPPLWRVSGTGRPAHAVRAGYSGGRGGKAHSIRNDRCKLFVAAFKLFQSLIGRAQQTGGSPDGAD